MSFSKILTLKVNIDFPHDVNLSGLPDKEYNVVELSDFQNLLFEYTRVLRTGMDCPLKDADFRWIFFSDMYDPYNEKDEDLKMDPVFNEKWYCGKFMTIIFLDNDLKYGKYVIPATTQEYSESKCIYDKLYRVLRKNRNIVGKYVKNKNMDAVHARILKVPIQNEMPETPALNMTSDKN